MVNCGINIQTNIQTKYHVLVKTGNLANIDLHRAPSSQFGLQYGGRGIQVGPEGKNQLCTICIIYNTQFV